MGLRTQLQHGLESCRGDKCVGELSCFLGDLLYLRGDKTRGVCVIFRSARRTQLHNPVKVMMAAVVLVILVFNSESWCLLSERLTLFARRSPEDELLFGLRTLWEMRVTPQPRVGGETSSNLNCDIRNLGVSKRFPIGDSCVRTS